MSKKSKSQICFEKFLLSGPEYKAEVLPVSGSSDVAIVMTRNDPYTSRKLYGQILSQFCHRQTAEKLCKELNQHKNEMLAKAYP